MTSSWLFDADIVNLKAYNAYLHYILELRVSELKSAYHRLALCTRFNQNVADSCCETQVSKGRYCGDSSESIQEAKLTRLQQQIADLQNTKACSLEVIANLEKEETKLKNGKECNVEQLEELSMLYQSESAGMVELKHLQMEMKSQLEANIRENESLKVELASQQQLIQLKEEAIAQAIFEKDELEEANMSYKTLNDLLKQEISRLETVVKERSMQTSENDRNSPIGIVEQTELLESCTGEFNECRNSDVTMPCSQLSDMGCSQQLSQRTMVQLELVTLQAEKEDLENRLKGCQSGAAAAQNDAIANELSKGTHETLKCELRKCQQKLLLQESQNTELIAHLLVLEDRLTEVEAAQQANWGKSDPQPPVNETNSSICFQEQVDTLKSRLETSESELQCCHVQLDLLSSKYNSVTERYRLLLSQQSHLEKNNLHLTEKLCQLQSERSPPVTCQKCVEFERLKMDYCNIKHLCDDLMTKLQPSNDTSSQDENVRINNSKSFHAQQICKMSADSSYTSRCYVMPQPPKVMYSSAAKSHFQTVETGNVGMKHKLEVAFGEEFDADFETESQELYAVGGNSHLASGKRQLCHNTFPANTSSTTTKDPPMSGNQHSAGTGFSTPQNPGRVGGRPMLSLSRRSPKFSNVLNTK